MKFVFVQLTSPSLTISRSICVAANDIFLFFFMVELQDNKDNQDNKFFQHPKKSFLVPRYNSSLCSFLPQPQPHPQATTDLLSALQICLCFLEIHKNGNIQYVIFLVWLLSFHFIAKQYFIVWIDHSWFIH